MSVGVEMEKIPGPDPSPKARRPNSMHRTSIKFNGGKISKVKHYTKQELFGMLLACILSLFFGIVITAATHFGVQYMFGRLQYYLFDFRNEVRTTVQRIQLSQMTCDTFEVQQEPILHAVSKRRSINNEVLKFLIATPLDISIRTLQNDDSLLKLTLADYENFEYSLNRVDAPGKNFIGLSENTASLLQTIPNFTFPSLNDIDLIRNLSLSCKDTYSHLHTNVILMSGKVDRELSGSSFHFQHETVDELLQGKKVWYFYPPTALPNAGFNPEENLHDYVTHVMPNLNKFHQLHRGSSSGDGRGSKALQQQNAIVLTQNAGDLVYIPEGWYHASMTISPEMSVSLQYQAAEYNRNHFIYYLMQGKRYAQKGEVANAIKYLKLGLAMERDFQLLSELAHAYRREGMFKEAIELQREALLQHPRNPYLYAKLINTLLSSPSSEDLSQNNVSELLKNAEMYGIRDRVLELIQ